MPTAQELHDKVDSWLAANPDSGIPSEVAHRMLDVESGARVDAVSPKGARGPMQLMPGTAKELGVDSNDPDQNIDGGMRYLSQNIKRFGSVEKGVAAYQAGPGAVARAGGIPNTSDGINTTDQYVKKIAGDGNTAGPQKPYRGDDTGVPAQPTQPAPLRRNPQPWDAWPTAYAKPPETPDDDSIHPVSDTARALASGAAGIGTTIGQGLKWAGDKAGFDALSSVGAGIRDVSDAADQSWRASMSPAAQRALNNPLLTEDLQIGDTPLASIYFQTMQMVPSMAAMGGAGGMALKGLNAVGAATRVGSTMAKLGYGQDVIDKVVPRIVGGAAFGTSQGLYMGLQAGAQAEEAVNRADPDTLAESPAYQHAYSMTDGALPASRRAELAKEIVAKQMGDQIFQRTAALTGAFSALTGGGVLGRLAHPAEAGLGRRLLTGAGIEAATLTPQMAGMQYIQNQGQRDYLNPNAPMDVGMPNAIASGLATGALFGGVGSVRAPKASLEAPVEFRKSAPTEIPGEPPITPETAAPEVGPTEQVVATPVGNGASTYELAPGDIGRAAGGPFLNARAAKFALQAKKLDATHEVVPVDGGFVMRRKNEAETLPPEPSAAPADQPAPTHTETPSEAPKPVTGTNPVSDLSAGLGKMGKGIADAMYDGLFASLQAGKTTMSGVEDPVLAKAKPFFDAGLIKSGNDLRALSQSGALEHGMPTLSVDASTGEVAQPRAPGMEEGDIGRNSDGLPFANRTAANKALESKFAGKDLFVSQIGDGQFVLRKVSKVEAKPTVDADAHEAATSPLNDRPEPTDAQKEAGNYALGHTRIGGLDVSIENPQGSTRSGVGKGGKPWSNTMLDHYGYIRGTVGKDKDHIDVFVKPGTTPEYDGRVYVVDQNNESGGFDEHKVVIGAQNKRAATAMYKRNYSKGWKGLGAITETTMPEFKRWLADGDTTKPFATRRLSDKVASANGLAHGLGADAETDGNGIQRGARVDESNSLVDAPARDAEAEVVGRDAPGGESVVDSAPVDTKSDANSSEGKTGGTERDGLVKRPTEAGEVVPLVGGGGHELEVGGRVVEPVAVDVVHDVDAGQRPADHALHDDAVLKRAPEAKTEGRAANLEQDGSLETRRSKLLDSITRHTLFDEYAKLGHGPGTAEQGIADAKALTGLHLSIETEGRSDLPDMVPMRFNTRTGKIEVNTQFKMSRGEAAQYAAEELLHAVDVTSRARALSVSSERFARSGDIRSEAQKHVDDGREYAAFLKYPLWPEPNLSESRTKAELFARLGALYFGEPARMRQSLPLAYEAFDGIFQVRGDRAGEGVSRKIWFSPRGAGEASRESGGIRQNVRRNEVGSGQRQTAELERLRDAIRETFGASKRGGLVQHFLESRRTPAHAGVLHDGGEKEPPKEPPRPGEDGMGEGDFRQRITDRLHDIFQSHRTFNAWHKTVGTQFHKAEVDKDFGRVFKKARAFEEDTSQFAMRAADEAPTLLPRMQNFSDALPDILKSAEKRGAAAKDLKAVGDLVHASTLEGHRLTAEEVDALPVSQQKVYKEVRGAIDTSLDDLASSEAFRMLRNYDVDRDVAEQAKANPEKARDLYVDSLQPWADRLRDAYKLAIKTRDDELAHHDNVEVKRLDELGPVERAAVSKELTRRREGIVTDQDAKVQAAEDALGRVAALQGDVRAIFKRVKKLKDEGYAPLMRYGNHTVYSPDAGEHGFFSMHESQAEANKMARAIHAEYPDAEVTQGIRSEQDFKLTQGISPDTLELFAHAIGADKADVFQDFLKMSVSQRSVLKRLIHRKGTPGFGDDVQRNLATFVTSNARAAARNYHFADMLDAAANIPKSKGDVKDEAVKLIDYMRNPQKEAPGLRALMFMNYLGGSVASALTNATQPIMQTLPYLAKWGGGARSAGMLRKAAAIGAGAKIKDPELRTAMARADKDGITAPHEIHQLYAESIRGINSSVGWRKFSKVWGSFFSLAEQFNRKITFAAAYDLAKDWKPEQFNAAGVKDAYAFAVKAVEETQGVYSRANRPNWARGALGSTLMTFKQFSIQYLEFLKRLPAQQRALAISTLVAASGVQGLPFAQDIEDVLDTIGQAFGYNTNTKEALKNLAVKTLGQGLGDFALRGATAIPGSPIDMQARLGLGNLIPGTSLLKHSEKDKSRDIAEFFGPAGSAFQTVMTAQDRAQAGDYKGALAQALPVAVQNAMKGMEMAQTGQYKNQKGQKIVDVDKVDALFKSIGLSPYAVGKANQNIEGVRQDIAMQRQVQSDITDRWAAAKADGDEAGVAKARADMQAWNERNPESKIIINPAVIARRLREMKLERDVRVGKTAPKAMRTQVQQQLRGE